MVPHAQMTETFFLSIIGSFTHKCIVLKAQGACTQRHKNLPATFVLGSID